MSNLKENNHSELKWRGAGVRPSKGDRVTSHWHGIGDGTVDSISSHDGEMIVNVNFDDLATSDGSIFTPPLKNPVPMYSVELAINKIKSFISK